MKAAVDEVWRKEILVRQASGAFSVTESSLIDRLTKLNKEKNLICASDIDAFGTFLMNRKRSGGSHE